VTFDGTIPVIDTMIGFPHPDSSQYDFIRAQTKDSSSREMRFPAGYMFKEVPEGLHADDPISVTLQGMDRHNIERGMVGVEDETSRLALTKHPDRFVASANVDPNQGMEAIRALVRAHEEWDLRAACVFPSGTFPQVAINDKKMYPVYAKCVELGIPIFVCAGVPGPRLRMEPQRVELIDEVMYDFPELVFVTRHGCEPWTDLAVKLLLKWPNLYYSTSAYSPKYYPKAIVEYANTRGADKIIYGGYFPMGLSLERIFEAMVNVPFRDRVWPKFLHENARRVLKLNS
jgi:predicted TIM-barrel fold metal-dependent hydrolase